MKLTPKGTQIIGTQDQVLATAFIDPKSVQVDERGHLTFKFVGESQIHWDTQETELVDKRPVFVCSAGDSWCWDAEAQEWFDPYAD